MAPACSGVQDFALLLVQLHEVYVISPACAGPSGWQHSLLMKQPVPQLPTCVLLGSSVAAHSWQVTAVFDMERAGGAVTVISVPEKGILSLNMESLCLPGGIFHSSVPWSLYF